MRPDQIVALCFIVPMSLALAGLFGYLAAEWMRDLEGKLWPRGLRWLPEAYLTAWEGGKRALVRLLWPEKLWDHPDRRTQYLESLDRQWRSARVLQPAEVPEWRPWANGRGGAWHLRRQPQEDAWV
jgi:hypothetical protein